jgi:hypothetical protein
MTAHHFPALTQHLRDMGLVPVPPPPAPDRSKRGWVPTFTGEDPPF